MLSTNTKIILASLVILFFYVIIVIKPNKPTHTENQSSSKNTQAKVHTPVVPRQKKKVQSYKPAPDSTYSEPPPVKLTNHNTLGFTLNELHERYKKAWETFGGIHTVIKSNNLTNDKKLRYTTISVSNYSNLTIVSDATTNMVDRVMFEGKGDGSQKSGMIVGTGAAMLVVAIEDPNMSKDSAMAILIEVLNKKAILNGTYNTIIKNKCKYIVQFSDGSGLAVMAKHVDAK